MSIKGMCMGVWQQPAAYYHNPFSKPCKNPLQQIASLMYAKPMCGGKAPECSSPLLNQLTQHHHHHHHHVPLTL